MNSQKDYYIVSTKHGEQEVFEHLLEVDEEIIDSVHYRILDKYKTKYDPQKDLNQQLLDVCGVSSDENYEILKYTIEPDYYYPRIYRPLINKEDMNPIRLSGEKCVDCPTKANSEENYYYNNKNIVQELVLEFNGLLNMLEEIFQYVHPHEENCCAFSNKIRNFILLCCTELEVHFKSILQSNNYKITNKCGTKDFVKLKNALKLSEYTVRLKKYPHIESLSPFRGWDEDNSTKSLEWYHCYNSIKHSKYDEISKANLRNALLSISALGIMLYSQFGNIVEYINIIKNNFEFVSTPNWPLIEKYFHASGEWAEKNYF